MLAGLTLEEMDAWHASAMEEIVCVTTAFSSDNEEQTHDNEASNGGSISAILQGAPLPLCEMVDDMEETMDEAIKSIRCVTFGPDQHVMTPVMNNHTVDGRDS